MGKAPPNVALSTGIIFDMACISPSPSPISFWSIRLPRFVPTSTASNMCFGGFSMGFGVQLQLGSDGCGILDVGSVNTGQQTVMHGLIEAAYQHLSSAKQGKFARTPPHPAAFE